MKYGDCVASLLSFLEFLEFLDIQGRQVSCTYRIFRLVQVFLVFFCRDKFPCTYVQKCIFLPSLSTRRCVVIAIS